MAQLFAVVVSAKTSPPDRRLKALWGQALKRPGWRWQPRAGKTRKCKPACSWCSQSSSFKDT